MILSLRKVVNTGNLTGLLKEYDVPSLNYEYLRKSWDFPGGPVVKIPPFHCRGQWVQSLVRELRSGMPRCMAKKKKKDLTGWFTLYKCCCSYYSCDDCCVNSRCGACRERKINLYTANYVSVILFTSSHLILPTILQN